MNKTGREIFLLVSILALMSSIIVFSTFYAPELLSGDSQNAQDAVVEVNNQTENGSKFSTDNVLLNQSITGLKLLYRDAAQGVSLFFQTGQGS